MADKMYKCAFKHCQHESCEVPQGEAVKVGTRYMHKDCAEKSEYIRKTRDLYFERISSTVVMKQLVSVLNNLVIKKNVDPKYLYFAVDFAVSNKIPIKNPYGLHYLVDNNRIKEMWNKKQSNKIVKQMREEAEDSVASSPTNNAFNYFADKNIGFGGIFGGK